MQLIMALPDIGYFVPISKVFIHKELEVPLFHENNKCKILRFASILLNIMFEGLIQLTKSLVPPPTCCYSPHVAHLQAAV